MPDKQTPVHELRSYRVEFRDLDTKKREVTIVPMVYDVEDDYSTTWAPGVFTDSLSSGRVVPYVWAHDWAEPIGKMLDYTDTAAELQMRMKLDDPNYVPRAKQALYQLENRTVSEHSVGFTRREWLNKPTDDDPWAERMLKADLDEVSVVLAGAVPGTKTLDVRCGRAYLDRNVAERAVRSLAAGDMALPQVLEMLGFPPNLITIKEPEKGPSPEYEALLAEAASAFDRL